MIFIRKIACVLVAAVMVLVFCSCTAAPPSDCRDELIMHKWVIYDNFEKEKCTLSFTDGRMMISAEMGNNSVFEFNGEYIADNEKITVFSENYGILNIGYRIKSDSLVLTYIDKEITFKKEIK
ncbi:MAG: hypothetical protein PUG48_10260 [Clostridia bacterium]|nr:hypothetical protein [Clostridia bacterium]